MYSVLDESNNEKTTSKGRNAFIEFQEFHDALFKKKILRGTIRGIKPKNRNLGIYETNKMLAYNTLYNTLAYEHKDI